MKILVCAASGAEAKACAKGLARVAGEFEILETGVGMVRAEMALEAKLAGLSKAERPDLVVSSGFAGALSSDLPLLSWVTCDRVIYFENGSARAAFDVVPLALESARVCRLVTSRELVAENEHGAFAAIEGPVAVDMETAALARVCAREGLRLGVLRMITDTPERPLPRFVGAIAAAMAETELTSKVSHGLFSVKCALRSPLGIVRLARDSGNWLGRLKEGWEKNAQCVRNYCGNVDKD